MFEAKILADSVSPAGCRLTTFEVTFPRVILAEFNTHRMLSRNAASSRAIPTEKLIQRVIDDPFVPEFRLNQKGMQAGESLEESDHECARHYWLEQRDQAVKMARELHGLDIHKQYVNRLLEPWMWVTVIVSATDWENFFHLRCHPDAEPSFQKIATMMRDLYDEEEPKELQAGQWHVPLWHKADSEIASAQNIPNRITHMLRVSVGRCARVSYLTHDGKRDHAADLELHDRLAQSGHWSPFEHVARAQHDCQREGNFRGFTQYRKCFLLENITERRA